MPHGLGCELVRVGNAIQHSYTCDAFAGFKCFFVFPQQHKPPEQGH